MSLSNRSKRKPPNQKGGRHPFPLWPGLTLITCINIIGFTKMLYDIWYNTNMHKDNVKMNS